MLPGFMGSMMMTRVDVPKGLVLIDRTAGTNIGDMTAGAGLAGAFDGITDQGNTGSASKTSSAAGYAGKTLASARVIGQAVVYGSNAAGYRPSSTSNITINLCGKNGAAPSSPTDGTIIGTTGAFANVAATNSKVITSTDLVNTWAHVWVTIVLTSSATSVLAELQLYAWE